MVSHQFPRRLQPVHFYARFVKKETAWTHIAALEYLFLTYGFPYSFYVDSHSIFRFVQGRDSFWRKHYLHTDEVDTQWKQVLRDCHVKVVYALSPQAKGKIERSYGWIQDHLIRTCAREQVTNLNHAQKILNAEIHRYNYLQVHSTTQEVPFFRWQKALKEQKSLFRQFSIQPPFQSHKDIFCLRVHRTIDAYRKVSLNNFVFKVNGTPLQPVELRIYPLNNTVAEIRFWCHDQLIDIQKTKLTDLNLVHF
jgi:hypothetical protein